MLTLAQMTTGMQDKIPSTANFRVTKKCIYLQAAKHFLGSR